MVADLSYYHQIKRLYMLSCVYVDSPNGWDMHINHVQQHTCNHTSCAHKTIHTDDRHETEIMI